MVHVMRTVLVEFNRDNGQSEFGGAEGTSL